MGEAARANNDRSAPSGISKFRRKGVSTEAGQTALTRTPALASSMAIDLVNMITPPLDAQ
jgi:hypothetical protein